MHIQNKTKIQRHGHTLCFFIKSAGIGRTGTFIAMDNLISQAKVEGVVRPFQIVEALRRQRVNMVQTRVCFFF